MKKAERHKSWWAGGGRLETTGLDPPTVMNSKRDRPSPLSKGPPALQQTSTEEGGRGRPDEASDPAPLKPFDTKAQDPNYSDEPTLRSIGVNPEPSLSPDRRGERVETTTVATTRRKCPTMTVQSFDPALRTKRILCEPPIRTMVRAALCCC